ncbi:MAG TPA: hypothetical protein VMX35_03060 [Acidobacteriota bacterium]|nr:hypothetical protein [Acidobacteriota bacterium]
MLAGLRPDKQIRLTPYIGYDLGRHVRLSFDSNFFIKLGYAWVL